MSGIVADVLGVALIVLVGALSYAAWIAVDTMRSGRRLIDDIQGRLPDLIDHADETLTSVDGVVSQIEEVSETFTATTRVASEAVRKPLAGLLGVGAGIREVMKGRSRR